MFDCIPKDKVIIRKVSRRCRPPESYNLSGILDQVKKATASHAGD